MVFGGIHLNFCYNCIFQGIVWDGCGNNSTSINYHPEPVLKLSNSSNITINYCSFQHSKGQAVLLSEVSRDVNISHCNFIHTYIRNNHYRGHGAAIHYSSINGASSHNKLPVITISVCNFAYNYAKSLVLFENTTSTEHYNNITFRFVKFCHNQGVSVYAVNQNIHLNEINIFQNNTAENGAGIYISDHSTITFVKNSSTAFIKSFVNFSGGMVFLNNYSSITFDQNSVTTFNANKATHVGAIYSEASSNVIFKASSKVMFSDNFAKHDGGAIYSSDNSSLSFEGNSAALFSNNAVEHGGAMYSAKSSIIFEENSKIMFSDNIAKDGGAVYSFYNSTIALEGNSATKFNNNVAINGGGIHLIDSSMYFKANSTAEFNNHNITTGNGGAIYCEKHSNIYFEGFSITVFMNNIAVYGGAVLARDHSDIIFSGNSTVTFTKNDAIFGATVFSKFDSKLIINGNSAVIFHGLSAKWCNNTCLPYASKGDVVTVDSNSAVWCSYSNENHSYV